MRLVGVVDRDEAKARGVVLDEGAGSPDSEIFCSSDFRAALKTAQPDVVVVATPPDSHHALVLEALANRVHVLCEKPVSEDLAEVVEMVTRAEALGLQLTVGMNFRYLATSQRIREYATGGRLGSLSHAQFSYVRHRAGERRDLNDYPMRMPYPMLFEQSIHHFDLIRYCYDTEVESLVADSWRPSWSSYEGDCCVSALLRLRNGARVNYQGTWTASWNRMSFSWRSEFERGVLLQRSQFDDLVRVDFRPELGLSGSRFKTETEAEVPVPEALPACTPFIDDSGMLLEEFVGAVRGDRHGLTTGRDHLRSLALIQACMDSVETGEWVDLA